jgi:predicted nucleic acid-binding protein
MTTFVDTGVWYASVVPSDPRHTDVMAWHRSNHWPLVTTDYVIDETLTLLRGRGERNRALALGRHFFDLAGVGIHYLTESDLRLAWQVFSKYPDRDWSFTDCTSRVVIEQLHIKRALTFDQHFSEFGLTAIEP